MMQSNSNRFRLFPWLAAVVCIFALIYSSSYFALLSLPATEEVDMRSRLTADYSPWPFLVFQPVDQAIIEEIRQEQDLPEQIIVDGSFWPTSTIQAQPPHSNPTTVDVSTSTPQSVFSNPQTNISATQSPRTSTPAPTSLKSTLEPTIEQTPVVTLEPTMSSKPTRAPKPTKAPKPKKPPKAGKK